MQQITFLTKINANDRHSMESKLAEDLNYKDWFFESGNAIKANSYLLHQPIVKTSC
jgi:hypothetical protein